MNTSKLSMYTSITFGVLALALIMNVLASPLSANAATYAYVTTGGDVKSVVADDWMTAITTAPNRHLNSGVLLLKTSSDFTIVGDNVTAF